MIFKRIFDIVFSVVGLLFMGWVILLTIVIASFDTKSNGLFTQDRVGQYGKLFKIFKIKSMKDKTQQISSFGRFLRKSKLDELPQLLNILLGQMSFVGPRPDIPGYYDKLEGESRKILSLKPGLTSEASIKYAKEEKLLTQQVDPLAYNNNVIFPDKVKMNLKYYYNQSIFLDLQILFRTVFR
ncbi:sugar transferase [uncultured Flavobacterium sp.]|uniref:sugar transferase n=1 Tax=uncultured Flavobacterium sp. TaxID=165435 RepID=UPI0030ED5D18|tara:strand:- start:388 stop:936 length:549 start_codon:yes stop_codon:yes gene_type:complete